MLPQTKQALWRTAAVAIAGVAFYKGYALYRFSHELDATRYGLPPAGECVIRGRVEYRVPATGAVEPAADLQVWLENSDRDSGRSDGAGNYFIKDLAPGTYTLKAASRRSAALERRPVTIDGDCAVRGDTRLVLDAGDAVAAGVLVDAAGQPVAGARVTLTVTSNLQAIRDERRALDQTLMDEMKTSMSPLLSARFRAVIDLSSKLERELEIRQWTKADGKFSFAGLAPTPFRVDVVAPASGTAAHATSCLEITPGGDPIEIKLERK